MVPVFIAVTALENVIKSLSVSEVPCSETRLVPRRDRMVLCSLYLITFFKAVTALKPYLSRHGLSLWLRIGELSRKLAPRPTNVRL